MTFKIETGIPIPETRGRGIKQNYPFNILEVGQSVLVTKEDNELMKRVRDRVSSAITYAKLKTGHNYCSRRVENGVRVWRIE